MSDGAGTPRSALRLTSRDAAIIVAALRQYEPYWSPSDPDAATELSELVHDITRLLADLRVRAPGNAPGLLNTFSPDARRAAPHLVLVETPDEAPDETPDEAPDETSDEDRY